MFLPLIVSIALADDPAATPQPTLGEPLIRKELSAKELSIGGVQIGRSNLYNAVGFFGTNMLKKQVDGVYTICWRGDDGVTLAFESGASGGHDQTITGVRLFAPSVEYKYSSDCKASKKVSAKLELLGVKLGDTAGDVEKKRASPSERATDKMIWHYSTEAKKKTITTDVEITAPTEKVNSIVIDRIEVR